MKYIYALIDPRTRGVCYVGQSVDPEYRFKQHVSKTEDTPKGTWIRSLKAAGLEPDLIILDKADDQNQVNYLETWWILVGRRQGWQLTNGTNPSAWRVGDDFKTVYADELLRMYAEHRAACERLEAEVIALAVERERAKWINRVWFFVYGVNAIFIAFGVVYITAGFWSDIPLDSKLTENEIFAGRGLFVLVWAMQFVMIYLYHTTREAEKNRIDWWFIQGVYAVWSFCVIAFGVVGLLNIIKTWGLA